MPTLLLVPSPLLGPATWAPVAARLDAEVVATTGVRSAEALVEAVVAAAGDRPVVLVPHSNAGLAVPALTELVDVRATVFVDAALATAPGSTALAPPGLLAFLEGLADADGLLPPWTQWWEDLTGVFPDAETRAAVEAEQPRLPLSYFTGALPVPEGWTGRPAAYLAFGDTYAEERAFAVAHGWPVRTLEGRHLYQLNAPAPVAEAVRSLLAAITP